MISMPENKVVLFRTSKDINTYLGMVRGIVTALQWFPDRDLSSVRYIAAITGHHRDTTSLVSEDNIFAGGMD